MCQANSLPTAQIVRGEERAVGWFSRQPFIRQTSTNYLILSYAESATGFS